MAGAALSQRIKDYLQANRQRHMDELFTLLRFPSISSQSEHIGDCEKCAEHLAGELRRLGCQAELRPWRDHPLVLGRRQAAKAGAPTVLLYGHYDVQPPEPLELWKSPPFEPTVRDGRIYARGASDDKGQLWAMLKAVEALLACGELPVNVLFLLEGEEEVGSPDLEKFITSAKDELAADCAIICDSAFFAAGLPTITSALRGLAYVEITAEGPSADLHSGIHGGAAPNPLNALVQILAAMRDSSGRATLPGFYDRVRPLSPADKAAWEKLPFDAGQYARLIGTTPAGGEAGLGMGILERRWARPTLDIHGIVGGYQGQGAKTVIPAAATAKVSCRLVADQDPREVIDSIARFVAEHTPAGIRCKVKTLSAASPVQVETDTPAMAAAAAGLREAFGHETIFVREGASVPISELFKRIVGLQPILMGFGLPDDNLHSPNEKLDLEQYYGGIAALAATLVNLSSI